MRQLKIDVLSVLVVTDKLELGEPQASGTSSPFYGRKMVGKPAKRAQPLYHAKNKLEPAKRVKEG